MKNIYNLIDDIMLSEDLIECGGNMIVFAEQAMREKNRAKITQEYKRCLSIGNARYLPMPFDKPDYYYISGSDAVNHYIALETNPDLSPVKLIQSIAVLGQSLLDNHLARSDKYVSEGTAREIIDYLNREYEFTQRVYGEHVPTIVINHNSHKTLNGFQPILKSGESSAYIFLYHLMHGVSYSPEYVLLHEFGHVVQTRYGSGNRPPDSFNDILSDKGRKLSDQELCECFADTFAIAVMCDSPFTQYDPFNDIPLEIKQLNKAYISSLLS